MRRRLLATLFTLALLASLVLAPIASAADNGRGIYGEVNDVIITNAGFILIIFFPTFVFAMSMLQRQLEKRKEARKAAQKAYLSNGQWRGGW